MSEKAGRSLATNTVGKWSAFNPEKGGALSMSETREQQARELDNKTRALAGEIGEAFGGSHASWRYEKVRALLVRALAACALATEKPLREALEYVFQLADMQGFDLGEYHASTDYGSQVKEYKCFGCSAVGHSRWPEWKVDFKHQENCRYLAAKAIRERAAEEGKS